MRVIIIAAWLLLTPILKPTFDAVFTWEPNAPTDNVTDYRIHYGNYSGNSTTFVERGYVSVGTATTGTVVNLSTTEKWFFRVTASDGVRTSPYSNLVSIEFIKPPYIIKAEAP